MRILVGGLFVFSGFVKAVDPWGTIFKVEEYLGAFGLPLPFALMRLGVFGLCAVEFIVGVFLLLGCYRRTCPYFAGLIMLFMLPLTLWLAVEDPVTECGCFGDAIHMTNWATFWKNVVLTAGVAWLIRYNTTLTWLMNPAFQWLGVVVSGVFIVFIELVGFFYQPMIDFRRFPEGSELYATDEEDGLDVFDTETGDDRTEEARGQGEDELVVMIPNVGMVSPATTWKLNSLYEWAEANGVRMVGVVSGSAEEIENWEDLSMASYPVYLADDSLIKEIVRGNPGVVYIRDGKILRKRALTGVEVDQMPSAEGSAQDDGEIEGLDMGDEGLGMKGIYGYLIAMGILVGASWIGGRGKATA